MNFSCSCRNVHWSSFNSCLVGLGRWKLSGKANTSRLHSRRDGNNTNTGINLTNSSKKQTKLFTLGSELAKRRIYLRARTHLSTSWWTLHALVAAERTSLRSILAELKTEDQRGYNVRIEMNRGKPRS